MEDLVGGWRGRSRLEARLEKGKRWVWGEQGLDGTGQTADFFILLISQDLSRPKLWGP